MAFDKSHNAAEMHEYGIDDKEDGWLITYADMFTLLFAFFAILVAISTVDPLKFERVANSMKESVGRDKELEARFSLAEIYANLEQIIQEEGLTDQAEVNYSPVGVVMRFKGNVLYESGSARLSPSATSVLERLADQIKEMPYRIAVEGHTDNRPISTSRFPSNWELSAGRASSVVRFFRRYGVEPYKLRAVGRADTKPLVPNIDENGRGIPENQARNRRVEVIFLATAAD
ncbi:MAG TPA: OmpA family protein [bacterium]|nr:OmpA family protein [bacterium]